MANELFCLAGCDQDLSQPTFISGLQSDLNAFCVHLPFKHSFFLRCIMYLDRDSISMQDIKNLYMSCLHVLMSLLPRHFTVHSLHLAHKVIWSYGHVFSSPHKIRITWAKPTVQTELKTVYIHEKRVHSSHEWATWEDIHSIWPTRVCQSQRRAARLICPSLTCTWQSTQNVRRPLKILPPLMCTSSG